MSSGRSQEKGNPNDCRAADVRLVDSEVRDLWEDPSLPHDCCLSLVLKGKGDRPFPRS